MSLEPRTLQQVVDGMISTPTAWCLEYRWREVRIIQYTRQFVWVEDRSSHRYRLSYPECRYHLKEQKLIP